MKKYLVLLLILGVSSSVWGQRYYNLTTQFDSVAVRKIKITNVSTGSITDSVLVKKPNNGVFKLAFSAFRPDSTQFRTVANSLTLTQLQTRLNLYTLATRSITTGYGLLGGGDFSTNRSHSVDTTVIASKSYTQSILIPKYVPISGTSQQAAVNTIYIPHNTSLTTITLPATAAENSLIQVIGEGGGTGGWRIAQNANQVIVGVGTTTTTGTAGYIQSSNPNCTITLRCSVANNKWTITSSQGTLSYN